MKRLALILAAGLAGAAIAVAAEEPKSTATPRAAASPVPQEVIDKARETKAKRKARTSRALTNADVKKSKGRIVVNQGEAPAVPPATHPESLAEYQAALAARQDLERRRNAAQALVRQLERESAAIEQSYYDENDPDFRDRVIAARFAESATKLAAARTALETLESQLGDPAATPGQTTPMKEEAVPETP